MRGAQVKGVARGMWLGSNWPPDVRPGRGARGSPDSRRQPGGKIEREKRVAHAESARARRRYALRCPPPRCGGLSPALYPRFPFLRGCAQAAPGQATCVCNKAGSTVHPRRKPDMLCYRLGHTPALRGRKADTPLSLARVAASYPRDAGEHASRADNEGSRDGLLALRAALREPRNNAGPDPPTPN